MATDVARPTGERSMFRHLILGAASCLATAAGAVAGPRSLERAMETNTAAISLPETLPSSIDARGCLSCSSMRMEVPATAQLFVGTEAVTMKELRSFVLGKNFDMVIFY